MEEIKKIKKLRSFRKGGESPTENETIAEQTPTLTDLYQKETTTPYQRAWVRQYKNSLENYAKAYKLKKKDYNELIRQGDALALKYLQGEDPLTDYTLASSSAGKIYDRFAKANTSRTSTNTTSSPTENKNYIFDYNENMSSNWASAYSDFNAAAVAYRNRIVENLNRAIAAIDSGKIVRNLPSGYSKEQLIRDRDALNALDLTKDKKDVVAALANIAANYEDGKTFTKYFSKWGNAQGNEIVSDIVTQLRDKGYNVLSDDEISKLSPELQQYLKETGYHLAKSVTDNKTYVLSGDYGSIVQQTEPTIYLNTGYLNTGRGYIVGTDGQLIDGDLMPYYNDPNSIYYNLLRNYKTNPDKGTEKTFNSYLSYDADDVINNHVNELAGRSVIDMSGYFGSPVVATVKDNDWNSVYNEFGQIKLDDPNITYYWKDGSGNLQAVPGGVKNSNGGERVGLTNWGDASDIKDYPHPGDINVNRNNSFYNWITPSRDDEVNSGLWDSGKDPQLINQDKSIGHDESYQDKIARMLLQLFYMYNNGLRNVMTEQQKKIYINWFMNNENKKEAIRFIYDRIRNNSKIFDIDYNGKSYYSKYMQAWQVLLAGRPAAAVPSDKKGGIIKASDGAETSSWSENVRKQLENVNQNTKDIEREAAKYGRSVEEQSKINVNGAFTAQDGLRIAALLSDVVGLVGAAAGGATGGVGSAVAIGSGFASMGLDFAADLTDDSVSTGDMVTNALLNTGLALGAWLGVKGPAIIKRTAKLLPRVVQGLAIAGVALDDETSNLMTKLKEGRKLDNRDWATVINILRMGVNVGKGGAVKRNIRKGANEYHEALDNAIQSVKSDVDPNTSYLRGKDGKIRAVATSVANKVRTLVADGKKDEAITEIVNSGHTREDANAIVLGTKKRSWKHLFRPETEYSIEEVTAPGSEAAAKLKVIKDFKGAGKGKYDYRLREALYEENSSRSENKRPFKSIDDLIKELESINNPIAPRTSAAAAAPVTPAPAAASSTSASARQLSIPFN